MSAEESELLALIEGYTDDVRHPIVTDCSDWEKIPPALADFYSILPFPVESLVRTGPVLRVLTETIYCMGYERGKREKTITFHMIDEGEN